MGVESSGHPLPRVLLWLADIRRIRMKPKPFRGVVVGRALTTCHTKHLVVHLGRDKYMFHQLNVIPTSLPDGHKSLLDGWYEAVLSRMSGYLNLQGDDPFPVRVSI